MPRRPRTRSKTRAKEQPPRGGRRLWILIGLSVLVALATTARLMMPESPARLRAEAEQAARDGDWSAALRAWRAFNATSSARAATHLAEAHAALSLGRAAQAERSLRRAIAADPAAPDPVKVLLEILRVEDRTLDTRQAAWESYDRVPAESRREVLGDLTMALLADMDDKVARSFLKRWIAADPADLDARVALLQRIEAQPRADDPDRSTRLDELEAMVAEHPEHLGAREALVTALADAGEPDRGRAALDAWPGPESGRDARYWRLRGRWELEYDRHPDRAEAAFRRVLEAFPQDWRSWSGLSRALTRLGRPDDARRAAEAVGRIRETLEPSTFVPRIYDDIQHLDDPRSLRDLADLADHAGLSRLAGAWRAEAEALDEPAPPPAR
jgi:tetratricopeptide (TPR) repeat protein